MKQIQIIFERVIFLFIIYYFNVEIIHYSENYMHKKNILFKNLSENLISNYKFFKTILYK
jgi:hypothetical protein